MPSRTAVPSGLRHLPPMLLSTVARQCGGDWRRCVLEKDGSITILNRPASEMAKAASKKEELKKPVRKKAEKKAVKKAAAPPPPIVPDAPPEPPIQTPVEDAESLTEVRDPASMEPLPPTLQPKKRQLPKHLSEPVQLPPKVEFTSTTERAATRQIPSRAPFSDPPRSTPTVRDRLSDAERLATSKMREHAPRFDKPIPPEFDIRDPWEKLDADRVASSMLAACRAGLPSELPLDMHADVLALHGVDFELVKTSVRNPTYVEVAAMETHEKKYPVLRFFRGDITTVVGLREAAYPKIIATYAWPSLVHDSHRPGTSKGLSSSGASSGGGGARKQGGLPGNPRAVVKRLRSLGAVIEDDELGTTPVSVLYQGQDLGKIPRKGDKAACESAYQRTLRKMEAIIRRTAS